MAGTVPQRTRTARPSTGHFHDVVTSDVYDCAGVCDRSPPGGRPASITIPSNTSRS